MLDAYLNQQATFTPAQRQEDGSVCTDNRGAVLYQEAQQIPCRRQRKEQEIITAEGQTIKVSWIYYCAREILVNDLLDGRRVQDAQDWVGLDGAVLGYKAVV